MATHQTLKKGWTPDQLGSLTGKTYVITGASSGTGLEASRVFLSKGAAVVMMNRNPDKTSKIISELKQEFGDVAKVSFIHLDLSVMASVRQAAQEVLDNVPHIDALICNAAIAQLAKRTLTEDGFESQLGVNYFGHFLLCGLLYERINRSKGRIVMMGSKGYKLGDKTINFDDLNYDTKYGAWNVYAQSKLAQMIFAYELQRRTEIAGKDVQIYVCHPGAARTSLVREDATLIMKILMPLLILIGQSAEKGSWPLVLCAAEEGLGPRKYYGPTKNEMTGPIGECPLEDFIFERETADRLWTVSEEKTGFSWTV